jgi:uncharacterized protein YndB with AHSA1/START domain
MKNLEFSISINAPASKVWQVLWFDTTYRKWTSVYHEGSHAVSDWNEGSKIQFLGPNGSGMFSVIEKSIPNQFMAFKHLGEVVNFEEQPNSDESKLWSGSMETYTLNEVDGVTTLICKTDILEKHLDYFETTTPKALQLVKELAENRVVIQVETEVNAPIEKVWDYWTNPQHIMNWNAASDDWHTTRAENDLKVGGKFTSRMEAKDGSFGFDFGGTYTAIEVNSQIEYHLEDDRKVKINFIENEQNVKVIEAFDAEEENAYELQQAGWQAIMNNFKKYIESN